MASSARKYGYINAKLRARLSKTITREQFSRMVQAHDLNEALQLMGSTEYADLPGIYHETGDVKMCELAVRKREIEGLRKLVSSVEGDVASIFEGFLGMYEVETLKDGLRFWFDRTIRGRDVQDSVLYLYRDAILHDIDIDALTAASDGEEVLECLVNTPYLIPVSEWISDNENPESLYSLEARLDREYFLRLAERVELLSGIDREIARRITGIQIDLENLNRLARFSRFYRDSADTSRAGFIPGGYRFDPSHLNSILDSDHPLEMLKGDLGQLYGGSSVLEQAKGQRDDAVLLVIMSLLEEIFEKELNRLLFGNPFTIGIVLAYCFRKRAEVSTLITILNGKAYDVDPGRLMQLL